MSYVDAGMIAIHLVFAALWIGAVAYMALAILPLARDGGLDGEPLDYLVGKVLWISRIGALAMLITGSHLMGTGGYFDMEHLLETTQGLAVVAMVVLWLALIVVVEIAGRRIRSGLGANLVREPARDGLTWFYVATAIGVLLFIDGALLTSGVLV